MTINRNSGAAEQTSAALAIPIKLRPMLRGHLILRATNFH